MLKKVIEKLLIPEDLTQEETRQATREMLRDEKGHQSAAFLMLMRAKKRQLMSCLALLKNCRPK